MDAPQTGRSGAVFYSHPVPASVLGSSIEFDLWSLRYISDTLRTSGPTHVRAVNWIWTFFSINLDDFVPGYLPKTIATSAYQRVQCASVCVAGSRHRQQSNGLGLCSERAVHPGRCVSIRCPSLLEESYDSTETAATRMAQCQLHRGFAGISLPCKSLQKPPMRRLTSGAVSAASTHPAIRAMRIVQGCQVSVGSMPCCLVRQPCGRA
jgi:hypothetical protein